MVLVGEGPGVRRALVLVLHDAAEPWMTLAADRTPTGACGR